MNVFLPRIFLLWLGATLWLPSLAAANSFPTVAKLLPSNFEKISLIPGSKVLHDNTATLSLTDIMSPSRQWTQLGQQNSYGPGFTSDMVWLKFQIKTPNAPSNISTYFGSDRPELAMFNLFVTQKDGTVLRSYRHGSTVPPPQRSSKLRLPFFPIELEPNQEFILYLQMASRLPITTEVFLLSEEQAFWVAERALMTQAAFYGSVLLLSIMSLALFIFTKDRALFYYAAFALSICASVFVYSSFLEHWDLAWNSFIRNHHYINLQTLTVILAVLYVRHLLDLETNDPVSDKFVKGYVGVLAAIGIFLCFSPPSSYLFLVDVGHGSNLLLMIILGVRALKRGQRYALFFVIGWGGFSLLLVFWMLGQNGVIAKNYYVAFAPLFGNWLQMICSAAALGSKFKSLLNSEHLLDLQKEEENHLRVLVQVVCHDIANPLTVIQATQELALIKKDTNHQSMWQRVGRAAQGIEGIINQVRRMEAVQAKSYEPELKHTSISELMEELKILFEQRLTAKNIRFDFLVEGDDLIVDVDRQVLLYDVFSNLMSNAIKFSFKGDTILVLAYVEKDMVEITFSDQGIGIPNSILPVLFDRRSQTSRKGTQGEAGTGFGMPLAKYFVDLFGGSIVVTSKTKDESPHNHGSTFKISLPQSMEPADTFKKSA